MTAPVFVSSDQSPQNQDPAFDGLADDFRDMLFSIRLIATAWDFQFSRTNIAFAQSPYQMLGGGNSGDETIRIDCTAGNCIIFLPIDSTFFDGGIVRIKRIDSTGNTCTINGGGALIDGAATKVLAALGYCRLQYNQLTLFWDVV